MLWRGIARAHAVHLVVSRSLPLLLHFVLLLLHVIPLHVRWQLLALARPLILLPLRRIVQPTYFSIIATVVRAHDFFGTFVQHHLGIEITVVAGAHHRALLVHALPHLVRHAEVVVVREPTLLRRVRGDIRCHISVSAAPNVFERALDMIGVRI